jgi:hypothetical protein
MFYRAVAVLLNLLSMCGTAYAVFAAVKAVTWHGAENYGLLALFVVGLPTSLIQAVVLLPLTLLCARKSTSGAPGSRPRWSAYFAVLLPAVTLATIATGMVMTGSQAKGP